MKMPRRKHSPLLKHTPLSRDIFGLRRQTLVSEACETEAERQSRVKKVESGVAAAWRGAVHHLGEEQAKQLFQRVTRRSKRGQGKFHAPDRDVRLLRAFDQTAGESVAALARQLHAADKRLGSSPKAIAAQIHKLVRIRNARKRDDSVWARHRRMAARHDPPTLLSHASRKK